MSDPARPRIPWRWSLLVGLGVIGFYFYLARPAEPVHDLALAGNTAYLALGRAGLAIVDASNPGDPRQVGIFESLGQAMAVAVDGQYAYLADGREGLRILDVSAPWAPVEVGAIDTPGSAVDVAIAGDMAYIADDQNGMLVVNVANRFTRGEGAAIGSYPTDGRIQRVAVQGEFVYLGDAGRTLRVVRVTNPRRPEEVAVVDIQSRIENLEIVGDRLYLAAGQRGLIILDVSNPAEPAVLGTASLPGPVNDVTVVGDFFAYLAAGRAGLRVLDINDPQAIVQVGAYERPLEANQVALGEDQVYLADRDVGLYVLEAEVSMDLATILSDETQRGNAQDVVADERFAYIASAGQGLRVIDIRDPRDIQEVAFLDTGGDAVSVTTSGDFIYLADGQAGWRVLFLADPDSERPLVQEIASRDTPGEANRVSVQGQVAYVADGSAGLRVFSLVDPAAPVEVGTEDTPGNAFDVAVLGDYAYVADGEAGLRVINVLDPARPAEVGAYDTPGEARAVTISLRTGVVPEGGTPPAGNPPLQALAYLADGDGGLRVVDVTDPRNPAEIASFDPYEYVHDLELSGNTLYLAARGMGLRIVDIRDLGRISEIGFFDTPGEARGLALADGFTYVADLNRGLRIIDTVDPARPVEMGFFDIPRVVRSVKVAGDYAYLADADRGFRIADISQPSRMREIGHYDQGGLVASFDVEGSFVYAAQATGLQVVNVADPRNPSFVDTFETPGRAAAVDVVGNLAFIAVSDIGLAIADVSQPDAIRLIAEHPTQGSAQDLFVSNGYVYIADGEAGLEIVNVQTPSEPITASIIDQFQDVRSVLVVDTYAFLADGPNGIWVIDVEKPVAPQTIGYLDTPGSAVDLDFSQVYLFVADGDAGVQVVYILDPYRPAIVGTAEMGGLSLNLDSETSPAQEGAAGDFFVFVAKGERGLEILRGSEAVNTGFLGVYQTPGMAPFAQVARDRFPLVPRPGVEKSARTVQNYLFDIFVAGLFGFLFWLAFFAQFVLPLQRLGDRWKAFSRLFLYVIRVRGLAARIENGKIKYRPGEEKRRAPGVVLLDTASAAVLRTKTVFKRVIGPGVVFTNWGEYLHPESVDLHITPHPYPPLGYYAHEDPFAPQRKTRVDPESDEAYQARQKRRMETSGLTRDGVEVVARINAIVKTKSERSQGGTEFGFNRRSVQLAITREGIVPQELRNVPWYEIPAYLAVDVWREYLSKFSLSDLFDTEAAIRPGEQGWGTNGFDVPLKDSKDPSNGFDEPLKTSRGSSNGDEESSDPPWLRRGETGMETVIRMVRQRLTQSEVEELDSSGRPTGNKSESREFRKLEEMGVKVIKVAISGIRFPQAVESQLVYQWLSTWLQRAQKERETIEVRRSQAAAAGEEQAVLEFANRVSAGLGGVLLDQDGKPRPWDQPDLPGQRASLESLLEGTQQWLSERPKLLRTLAKEAAELARIKAWVEGIRQ